MKLNVLIVRALDWPFKPLERLRDWLDEGTLEALREDAKIIKPHPLSRRCYVMSEPHLSGFRLCIGFESLEDVQAAHEFMAGIKK